MVGVGGVRSERRVGCSGRQEGEGVLGDRGGWNDGRVRMAMRSECISRREGI